MLLVLYMHVVYHVEYSVSVRAHVIDQGISCFIPQRKKNLSLCSALCGTHVSLQLLL